MSSEQAETSAINDQTNVCPTQVGSVADSKPTKKGRKSKAEKQTDETALRWTHEMVEFLMKAKFETYKDCFNSKSNNKKKAEGWNKVHLALRKQFGKELTVDQVKSKYQNLNKKWRDNSSKGKETTATGNNEVDPKNCKDDEFAIVAPYFAGMPGCGIDLGQATDVVAKEEDADLFDDFVANDAIEDVLSPSRKRQKLSSVSDIADIGDKMEIAFDKVSGSISNLANAMLQRANPTDELPDLKKLLAQQQLMLQQIAESSNEIKLIAKEQQTAMQAIGQSMQMTAQLQASMFKELEKLSK